MIYSTRHTIYQRYFPSWLNFYLFIFISVGLAIFIAVTISLSSIEEDENDGGEVVHDQDKKRRNSAPYDARQGTENDDIKEREFERSRG